MAKEWFKHMRRLGVSHFHAYVAQREVRPAHVRVQCSKPDHKGAWTCLPWSPNKDPFICPPSSLVSPNLCMQYLYAA